jgi:hypothetical protein
MLAGRAAITVRDAEMSDFRCFYEGGRLVRLGLDPYDGATWAAATRVDIEPHPPCAGTFYYPLWTAIAMVPLSILPLDKAAALWEIALLACACGGIALLARTWRMAGGSGMLLLLLLWSEPMFSAIANAQFGPVLLLPWLRSRWPSSAVATASQPSRGVSSWSSRTSWCWCWPGCP